MSLRLALPEDFPTLARIYTEAYNSLNIGEHWTPETALTLINHLYKVQPDLFFVAESEDKIVGAITAEVKPWWDGNHLVEGELFVDPNYQGKGIGKMLVKKLFETAKKTYDAVSWDTFTHVAYEHPLSWYKSLGFEEVKHWAMITGNIKKVLTTIKE